MFIEEQPLETIASRDLPGRAERMKGEGWRLVHICCSSGETFEVTYWFDRDYRLQGLRVQVERDNPEIPSITGSYLAAFTYENELKDLFGLKVPGLALDFGGKFYRLAVPTPFHDRPPAPATPQPAP